MREMIFKGKVKDADTDLWVEGSFLKDGDTTWIIQVEEGNFPSLKQWQVDPKTVCQYTGLNDKNGKKIFEGDILKGYVYPFFCDGEHNYYAKVIWFDNSPAFGIYTFKNPLSAVRGISTGNTEYLGDFESKSWEVIGNIFDNKELWEVKE